MRNSEKDLDQKIDQSIESAKRAIIKIRRLEGPVGQLIDAAKRIWRRIQKAA